MRRALTVSVFAAFCAVTGSASAAPVVINDFVDVAATHKGNSYSNYGPNGHFENRAAGGKRWGDSIGNGFDTESITLDRDLDNSTLSITFRTDFDGTKSNADYADIFIDTSTPEAPDSFNYAISLGDQMSTGGVGIPNTGGGNGGVAAGVYENFTYKTSNDIWSNTNYIYGGYLQFNDDAPGYDPNFAAEVATVVTGGNLLSGILVSVNQVAVSGGYDLHVNIDGSGNSALFNTIFDNFDILWGTGDCSNDAIWGMVQFSHQTDVPVPGAAWLLSVGLLGLAARRRKTA